VVSGVVVLPHFDRIEGWWPGIVDSRRSALQAGQTLVGIDEHTALWSPGGRTFTVYGSRRVWVFGPDGPPAGYIEGEDITFGGAR
jgi:hypothetical protein